MAYTKSKAIIGKGSTISIGNGEAANETFTLIGEVTSFNPSGRQVGTEDTTNLQSEAREFVPTIPDSGTFDLSGNYIGDDAGQLALEAAFSSSELRNFKVELRKTKAQTQHGDQVAFTALVAEKPIFGEVSVDKKIPFSAKLKVSGPFASTPGA